MTIKKIDSISPTFSMIGWDILTYLKGRKRMVITTIGTVLGYVLTNNEVIAILSGAFCEMGFALGTYYLKQIENKKE